MQRHVGVRGAGGRVADRSRGRGRPRWIGDDPLARPARRRRDRRRSCVAVGAPPVAAVATHLLGGDEVGAAPRHRVRFGPVVAGERPRRAVELADSQTSSRCTYATRRAVGSGRGSKTGPSTVSSRASAGEQPPDEQPSAERERDHGDVGVGRVRGDPASALAGALAPGPLSLRADRWWCHRALRASSCADRRRDVPPRVDVEHPQRVHRIAARSRCGGRRRACRRARR